MQNHDVEPESSTPTNSSEAREAETGISSEPMPGASVASELSMRGWLLVLSAALIAGLGSFAIGEVAPSLVPPSTELSSEIRADRNSIPIEIQKRLNRSKDLSAAITYGSLGSLLGLALGVAGSLVRGRPSSAPVSGLCGLVLGAVAGAVGTLLILPTYHAARAGSTDDNVNLDVALALATHGGIWLLVGAAAGLALGLGLGAGSRVPRALIGGMIGAALGSIAYEFIGAVAFPLAQTFRPVAVTMPPRLMSHLLVAVCTASVALWAAYNLELRRSSRGSSSVH